MRTGRIWDQATSMKVGQCLKVDRNEFEEEFKHGFPSPYKNSIESFYGCVFGSHFLYSVQQDHITGEYKIYRNEEK